MGNQPGVTREMTLIAPMLDYREGSPSALERLCGRQNREFLSLKHQREKIVRYVFAFMFIAGIILWSWFVASDADRWGGE